VSDAVLSVERLSHHFRGVVALEDVSLEVLPGEVLGVIGPNGAGKTTLLNAISGIVRPAAGRVAFRGEDITGWAPNRIARKGIARTFQMAEGFGAFTVWDYLQLSRGCARDAVGEEPISAQRYGERCREWLGWIDATDSAALPLRDLSYGVRKLIDLCRVVATEPALMLLDEPTSGLALLDRERMRGRIASLREEGRTLVIVDHDVSFVSDVATRVVAFENGRKIAEGTADDVLRDEQVLVSYLGA
jgi:branched-chain amino acid transport system ATP-binding protein